jgi:hypothetical protein
MRVNKIIGLALSGAFASAQAQSENTERFDGFISAGFGPSRTSFDSNSIGNRSSNPISELRASVAYTDPSGFGIQLDQVFSNSKMKLGIAGIPVATTVDSSDSAAHFFYRNTSGLVGAFVQQRRYDISAPTGAIDGSEDYLGFLATGLMKPRNLFGLEGQTFFGDLQISAQLGRQLQDYRLVQGYKGSGNLGSIAMNYFLHDNWKISLRASESRLVTNSTASLLGSAAKESSYGLHTEYRFASSPFSVFARYDRVNSSVSTDGGRSDMKDDRFLAGVKITFGSGSLRSQATGGASLNPVRPDEPLLQALINPAPG